MESPSRPTTPLRQYNSPMDTSPANSYRGHFHRRSSSFSSNHNRSPMSVRSRHRFSNASQFSNDFAMRDEDEGTGMGMGNLADELDQLDDDDYYEEDATEAIMDEHEAQDELPSLPDGARDSGIDVSYNSKHNSTDARMASKTIGVIKEPSDGESEEEECELSPDMEDALSAIARMAGNTQTSEDPLIPRTVTQLQDLGNQSGLESSAQRLTTSTNSLASNLLKQGKVLQGLSSSVLSPFALITSLDMEAVEETVPLIDELLAQLPLADPKPLQGLQSLDRANGVVVETLSQLIDTLQMGKQTTNSAARHLRTTHMMVAELRREQERADRARLQLQRDNTAEQLKRKRCAAECKDVMSGFEDFCNGLRESLVAAAA